MLCRHGTHASHRGMSDFLTGLMMRRLISCYCAPVNGSIVVLALQGRKQTRLRLEPFPGTSPGRMPACCPRGCQLKSFRLYWKLQLLWSFQIRCRAAAGLKGVVRNEKIADISVFLMMAADTPDHHGLKTLLAAFLRSASATR